jgi:hypothetical protein
MSVMRPLILASLLFMGVSALAIQPPPFAWARVVGAAGHDYGRAIVVDTNGNSYITGSFDGTATFGHTNITSSGEVIAMTFFWPSTMRTGSSFG